VQSAREAARRASCTNNLKQIGLGMHNHLSSRQHFPAGYVGVVPGASGNAWDSNNQFTWSWGALTLPYLEMQVLYDRLAPRRRRLFDHVTNGGTRADLETAMSGFLCPSDSGVQPVNDNSERLVSVGGLGNIGTSTSNYVASNTSYKWHFNGRYIGGPAGRGGPPTSRWSGDVPPANGIFWRDSNLNPCRILDGLSKTIMLGERTWQNQAGLALATDASNEQQSVERCLASATVAINGTTEDARRRGFSSPHPGVLLFLFCDGSVRTIPETIDHTPEREWHAGVIRDPWSAFERLVGRDDGQPAPEL